MQANAVASPPDREELSRDMAALANFLMRTANMGTFNAIAEHTEQHRRRHGQGADHGGHPACRNK